jgi:hypothetical protein
MFKMNLFHVTLRGSMLAAIGLAAVLAQEPPTSTGTPKSFDAAADTALVAMRQKALELKIGGVAVVGFFQGETAQSWSSKMVVVGRMKDDPAPGNKGANLLAIAYAKATEMVDSHCNSGHAGRPPMTGEFGWEGGVIARTATGYAVAAFSGGRSQDDVEVSKAGLAVLKSAL